MIEWQWSAFDALAPNDVYRMLKLRQDVFILEQTCLYPDIDDFDQQAWHLLGWHDVDGKRQLAACLRCLAPGEKYAEMSLGRVATSPAARGAGIGRELLVQGIARAESLHPDRRIRIGAQRYLERFYAGFGFVTCSAPYDEDGIEHVEMLR